MRGGAGRHLLALINDILDLSSDRNGMTRLARSQFLQAGRAVGSLGLTENYRMIGVVGAR